LRGNDRVATGVLFLLVQLVAFPVVRAWVASVRIVEVVVPPPGRATVTGLAGQRCSPLVLVVFEVAIDVVIAAAIVRVEAPIVRVVPLVVEAPVLVREPAIVLFEIPIVRVVPVVVVPALVVEPAPVQREARSRRMRAPALVPKAPIVLEARGSSG